MQSSEKKSGPILPSPLPAHPRLLAAGPDWARLKKQFQTDPVSARIFSSLERKALSLLKIPPAERIMNGYRLLYVSRDVLERLTALAAAFNLTGEARFARRAIEEMKAVCAFTDWNPSHYLDTAEMALAVAIAYDWLHDQLSPEEKDLIASALVEKGIMPSLREPKQWFIDGNNNWNQVCHAGMAAAAIAIADREPALSEQILRRAVDNLHHSAEAYAPDGAYPEGPTYWNYGTSFHVVLSAALERLTGDTLGTDAYPGFAPSADYIMQVTTPTGNFYEYADSRAPRNMLIPLFWFARRYQRPDWLSLDLKNLTENLDLYDQTEFKDSDYRLLALTLLWRDPALVPAPDSGPALNWLGQGTMPVAVHRSGFDNPNALYAAIKGGSPSLNHAHMDVGSFMIEADGITWATDLGVHSYEELEAQGINLWDASENGMRWKIFNAGPEGHNILRFNQAHQLLKGSAHFIRFCKEGSHPHSVLDLTALYSKQAQSVYRGIMLIENRAVLLQDEWTAGSEPVEVVWQMITPAAVTLEPGKIILSKDGKTMILQILDSADATVEFKEVASLQQSFDAPKPGFHRITINTRSPAGQKGSLRILATPGSSASVQIPPLKSLGLWSEPIS